MKKIAVLLILMISITSVSAQELVDPGITPDSPLYAGDLFMEKLSLAFTFNQEAKSLKQIGYAEERLAEAQVMLKNNDITSLEKAMTEHNRIMNQIAARDTEGNQTQVQERLRIHEELATQLYLNSSCPQADSNCPYLGNMMNESNATRLDVNKQAKQHHN